MPKTKNFKRLVFKQKFSSYLDFHTQNREEIYKSIICLFKHFGEVKNKHLTISICATIEDIEWETEIRFGRDEFHILERDLKPYFEKNEDYETCSEIINLTKQFIK